MAKRFSDTEKWKKPFIRTLPSEYKLFWLYLLDDCDHAGIWHVDLEIAEIKLGIKLSIEKARGLFSSKVVAFDNGTKWFLPGFIAFQYGELSELNRAHKSVIAQLNKYDLMGHISPLEGAKDKDKDKDMDKDKGSLSEFNKNEQPTAHVIPLEASFPIEQCLAIAMRDERWVNANKTSRKELEEFNLMLERRGLYEKNPADYKNHFANWKLSGKKEIGTVIQTTTKMVM
jgi:hypothetical protein